MAQLGAQHPREVYSTGWGPGQRNVLMHVLLRTLRDVGFIQVGLEALKG